MINIVGVGDLHGQINAFIHSIERAHIRNTNFLQVGDLGLGFYSREHDHNMLFMLDEVMKERNSKFFAIRGNHDNKYFWDHREDMVLQNVVLARDLEVLEIAEKRVLFLGGGISIDRIHRSAGKDYWPDEVIHFDVQELHQVCKDGVDITITHVAPCQVWPYELDFRVLGWLEIEARMGRDLNSDLEAERTLMGTVLPVVQQAGCKLWCHGHYHKNVISIFAGIDFRCLGIDTLYDIGKQNYIYSGKDSEIIRNDHAANFL